MFKVYWLRTDKEMDKNSLDNNDYTKAMLEGITPYNLA